MLRSPLWALALAAACGKDDEGTGPEPTDTPVFDTGTTWGHTGPEPTAASCLEETLEGPFPIAVEGDTSDAGDDATGSCGGNGAEDVIYAFTPPGGGRFRFTTGGSTDTLVYVRIDCDGEEIACNDDARFGQWGGGSVIADVPDGRTAAVVVDSYDQSGTFTLSVEQLADHEVACDDGDDEDFDGLTDCLDPDCATFGSCAPECPDHVAVAVPALVDGSTIQRPDEHRSACGDPVAAGDDSTLFTAPAAGTYAFFLASYAGGDPVLSLREAGCSGAELDCDAGPGGATTLETELAAGETVLVVVDGQDASERSDYLLAVFAVGPEDCANALDDDTDGAPDCLDADCAADPGCAPTCPEELLTGTLPIVVNGTTYGRADDFEGACGGAGSDLTFAFRAPAAATYTFDTEGSAFDTVLSVLDRCEGPEIDCDDDTAGFTSEVAVPLAAGQIVLVVVDAFDDDVGGPFQLRVQ